ncbi:Putative efflux (PET) family inner membrane protein YccS [Salmonella enterica subsp. enterica]|uniref:Efflux (PET) family inner membrane protein YccS n=1 Tax=Salmonella enterica I TaxID=59201 RepID=A0A379VT99_SALET|nr:Putative efflux (PET) family inner membrane protein YccS [Salmonella enterica subsp. enterica]
MNAPVLRIFNTRRCAIIFAIATSCSAFSVLMSMQAQACTQLARCILLRTPYQHDPRFERVFTHIDAALERMRASGASLELLNTLGFLLTNLRAI